MKYIIIAIIVIGLLLLVGNRWLKYRERIRNSPGFYGIRIMSYVFMAFLTLVGINSLLADVIFEALGLTTPDNYQIISLVGFIVLSIVGVFALNSGSQKKNIDIDAPNALIVTKNQRGGTNTVINNSTEELDYNSLPIFDSTTKARETLGENKKFRLSEANLDGVPSPNASYIGYT